MTPTRRFRAAVCATALLGALVVTGCADEEPADEQPTTASPNPTTDDATATTAPPPDDRATTATAAPPEDGATTATARPTEESVEVTAGDGSFSITLPAGWEDVSELVDDDVLLAAKESERIDDFFTNVVVTRDEYVPNLTSAVEAAAERLAGEDGEYELLELAPVAGHRAPGYVLVRDVQGTTVHQTQRWISRGTLYVVTFSAVESRADEAAPALEEILSSWTWHDEE